ncbi:hypothetical protein M885DRAFT_507391 [Pelagophyceae sp. CCMP2097]|nr:hypothetical protein M885DRAFT_507391 [Pelagophyceae sp. CCMP2097]|mmetsp:Transcript_32264/g.111555  ORF Transcript_32264/g.111555 Transcript_32264/m.111555 type:complete len:130 (-) Transcript_32264:172-561(-)
MNALWLFALLTCVEGLAPMRTATVRSVQLRATTPAAPPTPEQLAKRDEMRKMLAEAQAEMQQAADSVQAQTAKNLDTKNNIAAAEKRAKDREREEKIRAVLGQKRLKWGALVLLIVGVPLALLRGSLRV